MDWSLLLNAVPLLISLIVVLLSSKFLTKQEFRVNKTKRDAQYQLLDDGVTGLNGRVTELETKNRLSEQPATLMLARLDEILRQLKDFAAAHQSLEKRVLELEIERRFAQQHPPTGHRPLKDREHNQH